MTAIIKLSLFIDQHQGKGSGSSSRDVARSTFTIPFKDWVVGYVLVSARSDNGEEWTIKEIKSQDGKTHREDCTIFLINKAMETREIKGSTASSYTFKSTGDVEPPPEEERPDVKPFGVAVAGIREFYTRAHGEGTRLIMHDKTSYIVLESFGAIWEMLKTAGVSLAEHRGGPGRKPQSGAMTGAELEGN